MAFFGRLWRGEYSLVKTYWLFGVLVSVIFNVVTNMAVMASNETGTGVILIILYMPYQVVLTGGIWRSANTYCATEGKNSLWGRLAQIAVVLGWLSTLGSLGILAQTM